VRRDLVFADLTEVPAVVVSTLLFMEDRTALHPGDARSNPAVDWPRLAKAALLYAGAGFGLPFPVQGGSTLATQLEKFRHSPAGRTGSMADKLRQMATASLRAYRNGPDTTAWRRRIVVDYLNAMPLAAVPGHGEVNGLGAGLEAWFGLELAETMEALREPDADLSAAARAYKHVLALLAALPAPSAYLLDDRDALLRRIDTYLDLLARQGVIGRELAAAAAAAPLELFGRRPPAPAIDYIDRKATTALRSSLRSLLGLRDVYALDRLDLEVDATVHGGLQGEAVELLQRLGDPAFVRASGLAADPRLLARGDPADVVYSLLLFERTPAGNMLRVRADTLDRPFDLNEGAKLELGSTAKLRTLAHYLEVVALLHHRWAGLDPSERATQTRTARDPITRFVAETMTRDPVMDLATLLEHAMSRRYSASPGTFFTGGGTHRFGNYDPDDDGRVVSVREALWHSTNLVFIRLMRDLVAFHRARLPYDAEAVVAETGHPVRARLLGKIAAAESREFLARVYRRYRGLDETQTMERLLRGRRPTARRLAMLFYAWHPGGTREDLGRWVEGRLGPLPAEEVRRLERAFGNPALTIADFGYLLSRHPLEVWCAGELRREPDLGWNDLAARSGDASRISSAWLFTGRNRRAQDRRLRIRIEQDAFRRMTFFWRRLGFPFERLVPTYATAIGSSGDRPMALAELLGIVVNDGVRLPTVAVERLRFAAGSPYEAVFAPAGSGGEWVMEVEVARALRDALSGVVERGTARRLRSVFATAEGDALAVGGKTGTGDNLLHASRASQTRPVNRTATFAFFVGDRFFGVVTAFVPGVEAGQHRFTSALPLEVLRLFAPSVSRRS
jgi:membrane peptidoglycan carboxypeptidase